MNSKQGKKRRALVLASHPSRLQARWLSRNGRLTEENTGGSTSLDDVEPNTSTAGRKRWKKQENVLRSFIAATNEFPKKVEVSKKNKSNNNNNTNTNCQVSKKTFQNISRKFLAPKVPKRLFSSKNQRRNAPSLQDVGQRLISLAPGMSYSVVETSSSCAPPEV